MATLVAAELSELTTFLENEDEAEKLYAVLRLANLVANPYQIEHPAIVDCEALLRHLIGRIGNCRVETFNVLFLDSHNRIIADETLWSGTVSEVSVYPREVMRRALDLDSTAFIAAHNHPSGVVIPSAADVEMTKQLLAAARILGLVFHDHFIVANGAFHSMRLHESVKPWA